MFSSLNATYFEISNILYFTIMWGPAQQGVTSEISIGGRVVGQTTETSLAISIRRENLGNGMVMVNAINSCGSSAPIAQSAEAVLAPATGPGTV